jgi:hypothetical protein
VGSTDNTDRERRRRRERSNRRETEKQRRTEKTKIRKPRILIFKIRIFKPKIKIFQIKIFQIKIFRIRPLSSLRVSVSLLLCGWTVSPSPLLQPPGSLFAVSALLLRSSGLPARGHEAP